MDINAQRLIEACSDDAFDSAVTIRVDIEPMGGSGVPVKPAVYEGGRYQNDRRWIGSGDNRTDVDALVIDNVPSEANRLEAALERFAPALGLPQIVLDLTSFDTLPPHIPSVLSAYRFPHRNADAYLRDSMLNGEPFIKTAIGKGIFEATATNPNALMQWMPHALLYGFWQSHLGKKGPQTKLARSWTSEIVGLQPATVDTHRLGVKGDPLNLTIDSAISFDDNHPLDWKVEDGSTKKGSKSKDSLASVGHGQVLVDGKDSRGAVSFASIEQCAVLSLAGLRNVAPGAPGGAETRAVLAAIGLVAHTAAFGRGFTLRSGADLLPVSATWEWLGETGREQIAPLTMSQARALFDECVSAAEAVGVPVGAQWSTEPLVLEPNEALSKAIIETFPAFES